MRVGVVAKTLGCGPIQLRRQAMRHSFVLQPFVPAQLEPVALAYLVCSRGANMSDDAPVDPMGFLSHWSKEVQGASVVLMVSLTWRR